MRIAIGKSRMALKWKNEDWSWDKLLERCSKTIRTKETMAEYKKMTRAQRDDIKDVGGFVGGALKNGRRKGELVECRSLLTLDLDEATPGIWDEISMFYDFRCMAYSTHKHTPEAPRIRLIIPFSREVTADEYPAIARMIAKDIGIDMVDETCYRVQQLMYWPSTSFDGEFFFESQDGYDLNPDEVLARYKDWHDTSTWPTSSREVEVIARSMKHQADPLEKRGLVGCFCRTYSIEAAIDTFLGDVYKPSAMEGRYDYIPAQSTAGVVLYDDKYAYSHHATDPAYGMLLNSFDLVRVHKFPDDNEKKSFDLMSEFAANDDAVKLRLLSERQQKAAEEFDDSDEDAWKTMLTYQKKSGQLENTLHNLRLIMENDVYMKNIVFNQLADGMEIKDPVPWEHPSKFWRDADDAQLICYVDETYGEFSQRNYGIAVAKAVDDRSYHPIKNYFDSLPEWDKEPRVETLLIDYLGAEDNGYVRAVTRKALCAAYMRIYHPGIKFDYITVLNGDQGIGKSTLIANLAMEWFSDSLSISDMNDKTAAEKLQGFWIHEIGEMAGMRKADLEKVKAFVSRQDDKYRASFGRRVTPHPRQCIFFGTTNSENGYLRDITGNRRFWNVKVSGKGKYKPWDLTQELVDQVWAEVKVIAEEGEKLFLDHQLEEYAKKEQAEAMERDDREGLVIRYLDIMLPDNWNEMDLYQRRDYIQDPEGPLTAKGTVRRENVTNMEIWCECFGKSKEDLKPSDSYAISAIMTRLEGWERTAHSTRLALYGKQRVYKRMDE